jgi:hypothetical protein
VRHLESVPLTPAEQVLVQRGFRVMFVFVIIFPDDERTPHHDGDIAKGDYPRDRIDMS